MHGYKKKFLFLPLQVMGKDGKPHWYWWRTIWRRFGGDHWDVLTHDPKVLDALTPSARTKALHLGEYKFDVEVNDDTAPEDGYVRTETMTVPWTTVKEIMAAIRKDAGLDE